MEATIIMPLNSANAMHGQFQLVRTHSLHRRNNEVNDILLHGIMALFNNFSMAAAECSNYLLHMDAVIIPRTDSSPRVGTGAIDFGLSWKEGPRFSEWTTI